MTPYLTPYLRGKNGVRAIFYIAYATLPFQTYKTWGRSSLYLNPPRHLFNRKMTFFSAFFANPLFDPLFKGSKWARENF